MKKLFKSIWVFLLPIARTLFDHKPTPALALGLSHIMSKIVNSIAGITYYTSGKGGIGMRARVGVANPNTAAQQRERGRFAIPSSAWKGLAENVRQSFNSLASTLTRVNGLGGSYNPSGFQIWNELNRNLQTIFLPLLTDVPAMDTVESFSSMSLVADTTGGTLLMTFDAAVPATQRYIIYATPGMSPGINNPKGKFRFLRYITEAHISPYDLADIYVAVHGALPIPGNVVYVQARGISVSSGLGGAMASAKDIAV